MEGQIQIDMTQDPEKVIWCRMDKDQFRINMVLIYHDLIITMITTGLMIITDQILIGIGLVLLPMSTIQNLVRLVTDIVQDLVLLLTNIIQDLALLLTNKIQ